MSRRWRALSFRYKRESSTDTKRSTNISEIAAGLANVLFICGAEDDLETLRTAILTGAETGIAAIVDYVISLQRAFYEETLSCDLHIDLPRSDERLDEGRMDDLADGSDREGAPRSRKEAEIICTTEVGLAQTSEVGETSRMSIILKAKVVTDNMVLELFRAGRKESARAPVRTYDLGEHPRNVCN